MHTNLKIYNDINTIEIKLDKTIQNFLERRSYENYDIEKVEIETNENIEFIKISHISYDRNKSETDLNLIDFQQLLSAVSSKTKKFVYVIESSINGIDLYFGTEKSLNNDSFLQETFEGIYSGSNCISNSNTNLNNKMKHSKAMIGIPALKRDSDKEYKQSLERIIFPMQGKKFRIVLIAESYDLETIQEIISNFQNLGSELHRFVKQSKNLQQSNALSEGTTLTEGSSESKTEGSSITNSLTKGSSDLSTGSKIGKIASASGAGIAVGTIGGPLGMAIGAGVGLIGATLFSKTENESTTNSNTRTNSTTTSVNQSTSTNQNTTTTDTVGLTFDEINKSAEYCENLIDKYIERFQKGLNHGMWNTSLYIESDDVVVLSSLEHTLKSVYSGDESYFESIRFSNDLGSNKSVNIEKLPMIYFDKSITHPIHSSFTGFSTAINTEELSILSALPNNDIAGISVSKISSFGQTQIASIDKYNSIEIGNVLNKKKSTSQRFKLTLDALNSHLFVSGITGSGKSNTIKLTLLQLQNNDKLENKIPFLVIEPAKSEYKHLINQIENLQVFRPGAKNDIFKFNPFIFEHSRTNHSVTLTKHVDMLKTTFSSAFPMYGPMPYILEDAIHKIYEDKGWNFDTEDNPFFTDSDSADYDRKLLLFPNMEDLKNKIESVVDESGYAGELDSNIKAALKTRIKNLTIGIKGRIFNSRHAFDSKILFEKPTIIELSNITDDEEKSFLMGLLLNKLYQYREEQGSSARLKHITVIEEAHRLLPNISFNNSSEEASSKAKAVETFTNILAEIRSYGEGIIVADQIASKLHPDVIKNTNIKILQRTMDKEDRDLVGNSINLTEDQILDIAELKAGEAIVHNKDIHQAFMVKIDKFNESTKDNKKVEEFYDRFISSNEKYRYEIPLENRFYLAHNELVQLQNINQQLLKESLLELINDTFFQEKNILVSWNKFKDNIDNKIDNKNIYFYLFVKAFKECNYLSNIQFYKDIDSYMDAYGSFLYLVKTLIDQKPQEITEAIKELKKSFFHKQIKQVFPSMKNYKSDDIDYTLLILEYITSDVEVYEFVNAVMKEDIKSNNRFDKILKYMFQTITPELRHCLGAIRAGSKEINFNSIVKEGF